jgi:hypothetical protein
VGNHAFARLYKQRVPHTFRVVHENDAITSMPSLTVCGGLYKHAGLEVMLDEGWYVCHNREKPCLSKLMSLCVVVSCRLNLFSLSESQNMNQYREYTDWTNCCGNSISLHKSAR